MRSQSWLRGARVLCGERGVPWFVAAHESQPTNRVLTRVRLDGLHTGPEHDSRQVLGAGAMCAWRRAHCLRPRRCRAAAAQQHALARPPPPSCVAERFSLPLLCALHSLAIVVPPDAMHSVPVRVAARRRAGRLADACAARAGRASCGGLAQRHERACSQHNPRRALAKLRGRRRAGLLWVVKSGPIRKKAAQTSQIRYFF